MAVKNSSQGTDKCFLDNSSHHPDNSIIESNKNTPELRYYSIMDIPSSLYDFTNKDIIQIGVDNGGFTAKFSNTIGDSTPSSSSESLINEDKEKEGENVKHVLSDINHLQLSEKSIDFISTDSVMMHMANCEIIELLMNILKWLKPGGCLNVTEINEFSEINQITTSTLYGVSPIKLRYSSLYIQLLRNIQIQEEDGSWWRFNLRCSIGVSSNTEPLSGLKHTRLLAEKVPAPSGSLHLNYLELLEGLSTIWPQHQESINVLLGRERYSWTSKIFEERIIISEDSTVLVFNPRRNDLLISVDSHSIIREKNSNVWTIEIDCFAYHNILTKTVDYRSRVEWNETFLEAIEYLKINEIYFNTFVAADFLSEKKNVISSLPSVLKKEARVYLLEFVSSESELLQKLSKLYSRFRLMKVEEITSEVVYAIKTQISHQNLNSKSLKESLQKTWFFVEAQVI